MSLSSSRFPCERRQDRPLSEAEWYQKCVSCRYDRRAQYGLYCEIEIEDSTCLLEVCHKIAEDHGLFAEGAGWRGADTGFCLRARVPRQHSRFRRHPMP